MESLSSTSVARNLYATDYNPFREESLPLITFNNETEKFEVSQEVRSLVDNLKGPIGVVAVAGQYRTGKSYLLNRMLLNRQKGFGVGPTINPCTKGLWIWGSPINGQTPDGKPINVLVVDSEGIGGLDEDNNHDMRIFSLALLLSSYFLYNSVGSIDENALSNLSLVTNISKHIQFKSASSSDPSSQGEEEMEELIDTMPSFLWVVRDFALQLCDEKGQEIGSKEYLERALLEKGNDSKNDIRKCLKKFFKERECCTVIRPLTNEDELQNLEKMELDELRAEFVEQVMTLRKKVLNKVKPKSVNNQVLDASQWLSMVELYVKAINEGCVPNIQSSWAYLCRQNAQKSLDHCRQLFEKEVLEVVSLPMNEEDLEQFLRDQKEFLTAKFENSVKGEKELIVEFAQDLKDHLEKRSQDLKRDNIIECKQYALDLLNQLFTEFDKQIKAQTQTDINQIDLTLKELSQVYEQNAIDFSEKTLLLSDSKVGFLVEVLHYVAKKLEQEGSLQRQLDIQTKERLESQLKEAKEEQRNEKQKLEDRLKQSMLEKAEIEAQYVITKEQFENLKKTKDLEEQGMKEQLSAFKEETYTQMEDLRTQKDDYEEKLQTMQRHLISVESEFDKERALFEQKVEFLERNLAEKTAKEKDFLAERQSQKQGMSTEIRQLCQKYEADLKSITKQLKEENERVQELEQTLKDSQQTLEESQKLWASQEQAYKQMLQQTQDQTRSLELTLGILKRDAENRLNNQSKEKDGRVEQQTQQIQDLELQVRETNEQLKQKEHEFKKERALKEQKMQFLEMQLQDCKDQLEESYRQHEQMVKAMKNETQHDDSKRKQVSPSKLDALQSELSKVQDSYDAEVRDLKSQVDFYQEKVHELELQMRMTLGDREREVKELQTQLQDFDLLRQTQQDKIKILEQQRARVIEEADRKYKEVVFRFEEEIESKTQQTQLDLKEMQEKSEEALAQLRNFYEIEKEKLEQRILEEKDKNSRKLANIQEDLEVRMREDMAEKDEEIECLQSELSESEQRHQAYVTQMEHELSLKQQMMETLERQVRESRERMEMVEYGKNSAFEKQIEHFEQQRQEYNQKIDRLHAENLEKDRHIAQLQHKIERVNDDLERKKQEIESSKLSLEREKKQVTEKLENTKKKLTELQDDSMKQKLEFGREQALLKQQVEFQNKKVEELQKQCDEGQRNFDEKIKNFKQDIMEDAQGQIEKITSEKELWENKYEQKRRALKEIEMSLSKSNNELEKKVQQLSNNIERLEDEKRQIEEQYQDEIQNLHQQIQQLDNSAGAAYFYGSAHAEDVLKLKAQVQDLERELSDLQSSYDRDKALWEGKCQFLETQKETYKRDLQESQKKFEITLEQLQKRGNMDKDKFENNQQSLIKVIEGKYKNQIKEMLETHQCLQSESQSKMKRLENEVKILNEKLQMDARGKMSEYSSLEKKVIELSENEKRLLNELEEVKVERDRRIQEYQRQMDKDKEIYRQKLGEYEQKAKESESRRASLMFEYEKERAKWQLERDNLLGQKAENLETIEKLQARKDLLLRENEKMRAEQKGSRKYLFGNASNIPSSNASQQMTASHANSTSATRYQVGKSISSTVANNVLSQAISKMKENNKYMAGYSQQSSNSNRDEDVTIGSASASNQHTTPNSKPFNRYANN